MQLSGPNFVKTWGDHGSKGWCLLKWQTNKLKNRPIFGGFLAKKAFWGRFGCFQGVSMRFFMNKKVKVGQGHPNIVSAPHATHPGPCPFESMGSQTQTALACPVMASGAPKGVNLVTVHYYP